MAQKGFMRVVPDLIREEPWLQANEYARRSLDRDLAGSDATDPVFSLATTLAKEVREGRVSEIRREKRNGKFCYGPSDYSGSADGAPPGVVSAPPSGPTPLRVAVTLSGGAVEDVGALVESGRFGNHSGAVRWLLDAGRDARRIALDQTKDIDRKIKALRQEAQRLE